MCRNELKNFSGSYPSIVRRYVDSVKHQVKK